jgi:hypothetical protein
MLSDPVGADSDAVPFFALRADDPYALRVLDRYVEECVLAGDVERSRSASEAYERIERWLRARA